MCYHYTVRTGSGKTVPMQAKAKQENLTIVLNKPKYAGNVGFVARCARNMGIDKLSVVGGGELNPDEMKQMSTHFAAGIIDDIRYYNSLGEAVAGCTYVVGTTSRVGSARGPAVSPRDVARRLVEMSQHNEIALVFGPEDAGLSNDDIRLCHMLVRIPTSEFKSLNLSHAVMIICYEIFVARTESTGTVVPRFATSEETEAMYGQMKQLLGKIGFLNPQNPDYWMLHIRRFLSRTTLLAREVNIIRGICRQLDWYGEKGKRKKT